MRRVDALQFDLLTKLPRFRWATAMRSIAGMLRTTQLRLWSVGGRGRSR
jgi:hypothetical protein